MRNVVREPHQWKRKTQVVLGVVRVLMGVDRAVLGVVRIALGVVRLIQGVVSGVGELSSYLGSCARCSGSCSRFSGRCPRCPGYYEFLMGPWGTWGLLAQTIHVYVYITTSSFLRAIRCRSGGKRNTGGWCNRLMLSWMRRGTHATRAHMESGRHQQASFREAEKQGNQLGAQAAAAPHFLSSPGLGLLR